MGSPQPRVARNIAGKDIDQTIVTTIIIIIRRVFDFINNLKDTYICVACYAIQAKMTLIWSTVHVVSALILWNADFSYSDTGNYTTYRIICSKSHKLTF